MQDQLNHLPDLSGLTRPNNNASERIYDEEAAELKAKLALEHRATELSQLERIDAYKRENFNDWDSYVDHVHTIVCLLLELPNEWPNVTALREDEDLVKDGMAEWTNAVFQEGLNAYTYTLLMDQLKTWKETLSQGLDDLDGLRHAGSVPEARDAIRGALKLLINVPYLSTPPLATPHITRVGIRRVVA